MAPLFRFSAFFLVCMALSMPAFAAPQCRPGLTDLCWGEITPKDCAGPCQREYSAILWNIKPGERWEIRCAITPADFSGPWGRPWDKPHHCVNTVTNIWGVWYQIDAKCPAAPNQPCSTSPPPQCPAGQKYCPDIKRCWPRFEECPFCPPGQQWCDKVARCHIKGAPCPSLP